MNVRASSPLIVLLIDSDAERSRIVEAGLRGAAITRLASSDSRNILASISKLQPDVIIMDCDSPDRDTIENLRIVARENPKPVVMFVEDGDGSLAKEAVRAGVSAYIVDGLTSSRVQPVIEIAIERFKMFEGLQKELDKSKEDLEARKVIERAKGILMDKRDVSEKEAFASMRQLAMQESITIKQVAEKILSVASLLGDNF
ncbi:MAG: ANTAR domain-containing protein [Maricaulaceae bacterium]